jgi:hypothetical protein
MCTEAEKLCVNNVAGELIFQMHACLLSGNGQPTHPRSAMVISSCLAYLERSEDLPAHLRTMYQSLRDDWHQYLDENIATEHAACVV